MPMRTGEATTMTEIPNPRVPAVEPPVAAGAVELRRFHFSGPEPGAAPRIGALLPAGLDAVVARVSPERPALVADVPELVAGDQFVVLQHGEPSKSGMRTGRRAWRSARRRSLSRLIGWRSRNGSSASLPSAIRRRIAG